MPSAPSVLDRLIRSLTLALLVAAIFSLALYPLHWALNLTIHMQAHLLAAAVFLGAIHLIRATRSWAAVCLMLAISLSVSVRPWEFWWSAASNGGGQAISENESLRLLFWNVHHGDVDGVALTEMVAEYDVDVIALLELSGRLQAELDDLRSAYPVHEEIPRNDSFGIGVYSRIPGVIARRRLNDEVDVMILRTAPEIGPWVDVWAVHTYPPVGQSLYGSRNIQIIELAQRVAADRS
ncbi:MAG: endonuclease/exonuclease/phosphatase family protein, partial [Pirellulaceae bacterium]